MGKEKGFITIIISFIVFIIGAAFYIPEDPASRVVGVIVMIASIIGIIMGLLLLSTND